MPEEGVGDNESAKSSHAQTGIQFQQRAGELASGSLGLFLCSKACYTSAMCHCVLDASKSKWDQPRVHGCPQLVEPSFTLKTVLLLAFPPDG